MLLEVGSWTTTRKTQPEHEGYDSKISKKIDMIQKFFATFILI